MIATIISVSRLPDIVIYDDNIGINNDKNDNISLLLILIILIVILIIIVII